MPRPYSKKFLEELSNARNQRVGVLLAQACVKANLPAKYVAKALGVSRATVHNWFRGRILRGKNEEMALAFIRLATKDTEAGVLPVKTVREAKAYIEDMIGEPI
jgi:DNA-binding transcriptional regulator YiaG